MEAKDNDYRASYSAVSNQKWLKSLRYSSYTYLNDVEHTKSEYKFVNPQKLFEWQANRKWKDKLNL